MYLISKNRDCESAWPEDEQKTEKYNLYARTDKDSADIFTLLVENLGGLDSYPVLNFC